MQKRAAQLSMVLIITAILTAVFVCIIIVLLLIYKNRQNKHLHQLQTIKNDYEKNILGAQLEMQEATLQHISKEIHDDINLGLTLAKLTLTTATPLLLQQKSGEAVTLISSAIEKLTALSRNISANLVEEEGLLAAITTELDKLNKAGQYRVNFTCTSEPVFLNGEKELVIFRMVQEALNNIIKHAKATQITLCMEYSSTQLSITINDNGCGINTTNPTETAKGTGLGNLKKRAKSVGGHCEVKPQTTGGTMVYITIPITAEDIPKPVNKF
jgi:two-component system, NarL family, sensor kinase